MSAPRTLIEAIDLPFPTPRELRRLGLSAVEFHEACVQWCIGAPLFGYWASRHVTPWGVGPYGELVALVRAALGDDTDYSDTEELNEHQNPDHDHAGR